MLHGPSMTCGTGKQQERDFQKLPHEQHKINIKPKLIQRCLYNSELNKSTFIQSQIKPHKVEKPISATEMPLEAACVIPATVLSRV